MRIRRNFHIECWEVVEDERPVARFDKLHDAEAWVIAESERRESVAP